MNTYNSKQKKQVIRKSFYEWCVMLEQVFSKGGDPRAQRTIEDLIQDCWWYDNETKVVYRCVDADDVMGCLEFRDQVYYIFSSLKTVRGIEKYADVKSDENHEVYKMRAARIRAFLKKLDGVLEVMIFHGLAEIDNGENIKMAS